MGSGVELIDSGRETAVYAAKVLADNDLLCETLNQKSPEFYVSDAPEGFESVAAVFGQRYGAHRYADRYRTVLRGKSITNG